MSVTPEQQNWPRLTEAAKQIGLSPQRLRDLVYAQELPAVRDGMEWRVDPVWLAEYVTTRKGKPGRPRKGTKR